MLLIVLRSSNVRHSFKKSMAQTVLAHARAAGCVAALSRASCRELVQPSRRALVMPDHWVR